MTRYLIIALGIMFSLSGSAQNQQKSMNTSNKPKVYIGYYLKTLDNLLTSQIDSIHQINGLTRAEWQMLNGVAEKPKIDRDSLLSVLSEFTDRVTVKKLLNGLIEQGLIEGIKQLSLTSKGQKVYIKSLEMQKAFRKKVMQGISKEDYQNVIFTLDKMIKNLTE